jgi:hypothetical protein
MFENEDYFNAEDYKNLPPHLQRPCMIKKNVNYDKSFNNINNISTEKLLEASLNSLEHMSKNIKNSNRSLNNFAFNDNDDNNYDEGYIKFIL